MFKLENSTPHTVATLQQNDPHLFSQGMPLIANIAMLLLVLAFSF